MNPALSGIAAILMWSMLALFTAASGNVPPFQLLAMTFAIGSAIGFAGWALRRPSPAAFALPPVVWLIGIGGLFGYHFFYYTALRNAPVAEAGLIAYLWPLLIVLFSTFLPGEKLRWYHVSGAVLGFAGAATLIASTASSGQGNPADSIGYFGYGSALLCAFIWSGYSVLSRAFKQVSTDAVVLYCLATAILALVCHLLLETTVWPQTAYQWLAVLALGTMPVGLAFYAWDHAMKNGPIQLLGSMSYFAPVLSTVILVSAGLAEFTWQLMAATILVTAGALVASGRIFKSPRNREKAGDTV